MSFAVTPTLFLGRPEDEVWLGDLVSVDTVEGAVAVITRGGSALLPEESWDTAREVLRRFNCPDRWIDHRFRFARTGQLQD